MIPSLSAAVTGIDANQTMLDVIANNIANVDTTGYQAQSVQFGDLLSQQIAGATAPGPNTGGTNPIEVGSGTEVVANNTDFAQGSIVATDIPSDLAIQGSGFLIGQLGNQVVYTRDGELTLNANGQLVTANGAIIQGWMAPVPGGQINTSGPLGAVSIPQQEVAPAKATSVLNLTGNLPPAPSGSTTPVTISATAYDSSGNAVPITITFTPTSTPNTWTLQASVGTGSSAQNLFSTAPTVTFQNGQISSISGVTAGANGSYTVTSNQTAGPFPSGSISLVFPPPNTPGAFTQYGGDQTAEVGSQDGYPVGTMNSYSISQNGTIYGNFSNGQTLALGQIALANFANPEGLVHVGGTNYATSPNSGPPQIGTPGTGGRGTILGGSLEQSNVDLGTELTNLIIAQNAYQANTKVVTTSDQVLQALENMP